MDSATDPRIIKSIKVDLVQAIRRFGSAPTNTGFPCGTAGHWIVACSCSPPVHRRCAGDDLGVCNGKRRLARTFSKGTASSTQFTDDHSWGSARTVLPLLAGYVGFGVLQKHPGAGVALCSGMTEITIKTELSKGIWQFPDDDKGFIQWCHGNPSESSRRPGSRLNGRRGVNGLTGRER